MGFKIAVLDDEPFNLNMYRRQLRANGYQVDAFGDADQFLDTIGSLQPDMVLLDIRMPDMDGFEVCRRLRADGTLGGIPILFVTAIDTKESRSLAFAAGADAYLTKPVREAELLDKIEHCARREGHLPRAALIPHPETERSSSRGFLQFKQELIASFGLRSSAADTLSRCTVETIYAGATEIGISEHQLALAIAEFKEIPYLPYLDPDQVSYRQLSSSFCHSNQVVPMSIPEYGDVLVVCNPFDINLLSLIEQCMPDFDKQSLCMTKPESIRMLHISEKQGLDDTPLLSSDEEEHIRLGKGPTELESGESLDHYPILVASQAILKAAILENVSDIHVEPQGHSTLIRFRIDGELHSRFLLHAESGKMLVARFKVLADMDIAEQRRPQDGSFTFIHNNREYRLRIATSLTTYGEGVTLRLLSLSGTHPEPMDLGMTARQGDDLVEIAAQRSGLVLVVGPTGAGKTTTAYSFLQSIDRKKRNVISVEDPIEYRMPNVTQQQINEKIGVSFESLLKASVRQDPDVLFLGEVRDDYSAQVAVDFSSTGRLTIATLHTSDAASAIFRLERLGISREDVSDCLLCIIAQQLVRCLCPHCREVGAISKEERTWLEGHGTPVPDQVARPAGCPRCKYKGYLGREGIFEIMRFTPAMLEMVRDGSTIPNIRRFAVQSGCWLFAQHAIQKVGNLAISPADAYLQFLQRDKRAMPIANANKTDEE